MGYSLKHGPIKKELVAEFYVLYAQKKFRKIVIPGGTVGFQKISEDSYILAAFYSNSMSITGGVYTIHFNKVEDILNKISFPGNVVPEKNYRTTIRDNKKYSFDENSKVYFSLDLYSNEDNVELEDFVMNYRKYIKRITHYIEIDGQKFIDHYSYLPNVLAEMDKLEKEGKYWNGGAKRDGILSGGGDGFFRGLIISKLCNDMNLENKINRRSFLYRTRCLDTLLQ